MKYIYSNILKFNRKNLHKIIKILKNRGILGLPTETVYGLAGNAYSLPAVKKIFKYKKRPKTNPLIVHYCGLKQANKDVILNKNFFKIYKKFCPGPITFILKRKKNSNISSLACANLKTVGIRFPKNQKIRKILNNLDFPLAMPSANQSSGLSPTNPFDVSEEFNNKIKVVDGGSCKFGIESTVIDLSSKTSILRPGVISPKQLSKILKDKIPVLKKHKKIKSPGLFKKHYSPNIPMKLNQINSPRNCAFITFGSKYPVTKNSFNLSKKSNLNEAAKNLFRLLRLIKKMKFKKIYVVKIPNRGIGIAINDRLRHAAVK